MRRAALLLFVSLPLALLAFGARRPPTDDEAADANVHAVRFHESNWPQFSTQIDDRRTFATPITAQDISRLHLNWSVNLPEAVDSSPLFAATVPTASGVRDLVIIETSSGRLCAYDTRTGAMVWHTDPPAGPRWTTSSPAIDPAMRYVYAYCLDGAVHRYAIEDGHEVTGDGWPVLITKKGDVEKGSSNIIIAAARDGKTYLYMSASAYPVPGDDGNYQGHLVAVDIDSGTAHVFNALCSDRSVLFDASGGAGDCAQTQAGIWARPAAVYDAATDRIFVTTGNGPNDAAGGGYNWGTSVVALRPDGSTDTGTPLDSYTPENFQELTDDDVDMSSTTIAVLPLARTATRPRLGVQSGKDGKVRLLNLDNLSGRGGPRNLGGELDLVALPQGGEVLTQPATALDSGHADIFIANDNGVSALRLAVTPRLHLTTLWTTTGVTGTSPILANGLLFVAASGALTALDPLTGHVMWRDTSIRDIHWQSPIAVNGQLFLCDQTATLYAYALH